MECRVYMWLSRVPTCKKSRADWCSRPPKDEPLEVPIREVDRILVFWQCAAQHSGDWRCACSSKFPVIFSEPAGGVQRPPVECRKLQTLTAEARQFERQHNEGFGIATATGTGLRQAVEF